MRSWLALLVCWSLVVVPSLAVAQPSPADRMMAQALFDDARRLVDQGDVEQACPKFEESNRLDPGIGVQFRLADCYEQVGRLARAWITFVDVAAASRSQGQTRREAVARQRAQALQPRLSKLRIVVEDPTAELVVKRNGVAVGRAQWGTPGPVEPGEHVVTAEAPGHRGWRQVVTVVGEGAEVSAVIPPLEELDGAAPAPRPPVSPTAADSDTLRRGFAIGIGALGLLCIGAGTAAGVVAIDKKEQADDHCDADNNCLSQGVTLRDEARDAASVSTVSFVVAAAAVTAGAIVWLTVDDDDPSSTGAHRAVLSVGLAPLAVAEGMGLSVIGRF